MWHHLASSILNDLLSGSWITRSLSMGLLLLSLFSLGYLGGSSLQTLRTIGQPATSLTRTNGSASERWSGSLMERREMWQPARSSTRPLKPESAPLSTKTTGNDN